MERKQIYMALHQKIFPKKQNKTTKKAKLPTHNLRLTLINHSKAFKNGQNTLPSYSYTIPTPH